jgi:hypothetical protein
MADEVLLTNKTKTGDEETRAFLNISSSGEDFDGRTSVSCVEQGEYVTETDFLKINIVAIGRLLVRKQEG